MILDDLEAAKPQPPSTLVSSEDVDIAVVSSMNFGFIVNKSTIVMKNNIKTEEKGMKIDKRV